MDELELKKSLHSDSARLIIVRAMSCEHNFVGLLFVFL
jgi:hypothetical protein